MWSVLSLQLRIPSILRTSWGERPRFQAEGATVLDSEGVPPSAALPRPTRVRARSCAGTDGRTATELQKIPSHVGQLPCRECTCLPAVRRADKGGEREALPPPHTVLSATRDFQHWYRHTPTIHEGVGRDYSPKTPRVGERNVP